MHIVVALFDDGIVGENASAYLVNTTFFFHRLNSRLPDTNGPLLTEIQSGLQLLLFGGGAHGWVGNWGI